MDHEGRLNLDEIRALIRLAAESEITELFVDAPHVKVRITKAAAGSSPAAPATSRSATDGQSTPGPEAGYVPIVAPMVGTFYRSPKPDAPPFVVEGDTVEVGQTVCILEAMKLFNEIPSEIAGRIARILVDNGAPVEYGQPLFLVAPTTAPS
jgi:acetyl-CoA carboxylase biotin carboxyl carrier protein